jgi:hypothetical protein
MPSLHLSLGQFIFQMHDLNLCIKGLFDYSFLFGTGCFESMAQGPYCLHIGIGNTRGLLALVERIAKEMIPVEVWSQLNRGCERGVPKMKPLHPWEGTLPKSHQN